MKMRPKKLFSSTAKLKCRKIKFLDQKAKITCREKTFKNWSFPKPSKLEVFFRRKIFIPGWKEKTDLETSSNPNGESHGKFFWNKEKDSWNQEVSYKAIYVNLHNRELFSPSRVLFLLDLQSHCYLIRYTRWGLVFYIIFIFFSTLKQDQSTDFHKTEKERLYCTHCQTSMWNFLISLFYYNQQWRFYYAKLLGTPEEDHQVLGFINPVVDSDD